MFYLEIINLSTCCMTGFRQQSAICSLLTETYRHYLSFVLFLCIPVAVFQWRHSEFLLEAFAEIARFLEADLLGYLRNAVAGGGYEFLRFVKADFPHEVTGGVCGQALQFLEEG